MTIITFVSLNKKYNKKFYIWFIFALAMLHLLSFILNILISIELKTSILLLLVFILRYWLTLIIFNQMMDYNLLYFNICYIILFLSCVLVGFWVIYQARKVQSVNYPSCYMNNRWCRFYKILTLCSSYGFSLYFCAFLSKKKTDKGGNDDDEEEEAYFIKEMTVFSFSLYTH